MPEFDPRALEVVERLRRAGFRTVLVGGCVRDSLLGRTPQDWDLCTSARPEQVLALTTCSSAFTDARTVVLAAVWQEG